MNPVLSHILKNLDYQDKKEVARFVAQLLEADKDAAKRDAEELFDRAVEAVEQAMGIKYNPLTRRRPQPAARHIVHCVLYEKGLSEQEVDSLCGVSSTSAHYARGVVANWKNYPSQYAAELEAYVRVKEALK